MPLQFGSVRLWDSVGPVVHHAVFQSAVEENIAPGTVDPILLPAFQGPSVNVVALSRASFSAHPILLDHAIPQNQLDLAASGWRLALRGEHIPFSQPEIELPVFRR